MAKTSEVIDLTMLSSESSDGEADKDLGEKSPPPVPLQQRNRRSPHSVLIDRNDVSLAKLVRPLTRDSIAESARSRGPSAVENTADRWGSEGGLLSKKPTKLAPIELAPLESGVSKDEREATAKNKSNHQPPLSETLHLTTHQVGNLHESDKPMDDIPQPDAVIELPLHDQMTENIEEQATSAVLKQVPLTLIDVELALRKHLKQLYDDHGYDTKYTLREARLGSIEPDSPESNLYDQKKRRSSGRTHLAQSGSLFRDMKPIQFMGSPERGSDMQKISVDIITEQGKKKGRTVFSVPFTRYTCPLMNLPPYTSYIQFRQNTLAENVNQLIYWPYFSDSFNEKADLEEVEKAYQLITDEDREKGVMQSQIAHKFADYVEAFLAEIGGSMADILYYLLSPTIPRLTLNLSQDEQQAYISRGQHCKEKFNRDKPRWRKVFMTLAKPTDEKMATAGLICYVFFSLCGFSIWHVAKRSILARPCDEISPQGEQEHTFQNIACRICQLHACPYHGELREYPPKEDECLPREMDISQLTDHTEQSDSSGPYDETDVDPNSSDDEPPNINFKWNVTAISRGHHSDSTPLQGPEISLYEWRHNDKAKEITKRPPFLPCNHEGPCTNKAKCQCVRDRVACEKFCACDSPCGRRFLGCDCRQGKRPCWENYSCNCFAMNRECDPDLCGSCGATEVLDPVNRYNHHILDGRCKNVYIQRNVPRRTLLGNSLIKGWGLYMGENVKTGEYIGEYKGDIVTKRESHRRGGIYHNESTEYLFKLNKRQEVDSTRAGNKIRFINHAVKHANIEARLMLCNGVTRIGMFSKRGIRAGEELLFDYGLSFVWKDTKVIEPGGQAQLVAVKQTTSKGRKAKKTGISGTTTTTPTITTVTAKKTGSSGAPTLRTSTSVTAKKTGSSGATTTTTTTPTTTTAKKTGSVSGATATAKKTGSKRSPDVASAPRTELETFVKAHTVPEPFRVSGKNASASASSNNSSSRQGARGLRTAINRLPSEDMRQIFEMVLDDEEDDDYQEDEREAQSGSGLERPNNDVNAVEEGGHPRRSLRRLEVELGGKRVKRF